MISPWRSSQFLYAGLPKSMSVEPAIPPEPEGRRGAGEERTEPSSFGLVSHVSGQNPNPIDSEGTRNQ